MTWIQSLAWESLHIAMDAAPPTPPKSLNMEIFSDSSMVSVKDASIPDTISSLVHFQ